MKDILTFEEIFNQDGLYKATEGFIDGVCFEIKDGILYTLTYKNKDDLMPERENFPVYKGLFSKKYVKVYTRQSLFTS